jgi:cobalt/nickel transport system ATP-binding protein
VSEPTLETREVRYRYPGGVVGLDGATLALNPGEKVALLGPNGCGKTTLLLHLCGALRPQQGEVRLNGRPVEYTRAGLRELRRLVGTVLQDADEQLFAASVYQDVSFGPLNLGLSEAEVRQWVEEALVSLGIEDLADRPPHRLSLGQKKRAALAGVVAMKPQVIVLDEPTAGLDPAGIAALLTILDGLQGNGTQITFATHDVDFAYGWADRVAVLCRGQVVAFGPPDDLFRCRDLLDTAKLRAPWVVDVGDALRAAGVWPKGTSLPRSPDAFRERLVTLHGPIGNPVTS